ERGGGFGAPHQKRAAGGPAVEPRLAFARQPHPVVLVDAGGNLDRQGLVPLDAPRAAAGRTRLRNDLARAVALRAGLLQREETLRHAHLTVPVAGGTGLRVRPGLGPRAVTGLAGLHRRDADLRLGAARGFLDR